MVIRIWIEIKQFYHGGIGTGSSSRVRQQASGPQIEQVRPKGFPDGDLRSQSASIPVNYGGALYVSK